MSASLLSDTIAASYTSDTILPTVAETRSVNTSVIFVISVPVVPIDFVQTEDYIVTFIQFRTINIVP